MTEAMIRVALLIVSLPVPLAERERPQQAPAQQEEQQRPVDEIVVVSASRREEQLRNAPATMTVVTDAGIGNAPGPVVTDLMRAVPGVNVSQTSARDVNVTPRAATGTLSDSLLVLLDGRSIYQDFFGAVLWDFLPIQPEEIKQVEVIRGPASAVWGANAMNGVVNAISKTPREMQGTSVGIRFGQFDRTPSRRAVRRRRPVCSRCDARGRRQRPVRLQDLGRFSHAGSVSAPERHHSRH